jgi:hypothetical protein
MVNQQRVICYKRKVTQLQLRQKQKLYSQKWYQIFGDHPFLKNNSCADPFHKKNNSVVVQRYRNK